MVLAGFGFDGGGWVRMGRSSSTTQRHPSQIVLVIYLFFGGCGLSFMGCNGLMLVGYGGGCGLILGFG